MECPKELPFIRWAEFDSLIQKRRWKEQKGYKWSFAWDSLFLSGHELCFKMCLWTLGFSVLVLL